MTSDNIEFYARLKNIQELQHKREQKRMDLQRRFDSYVTSDHRLSRLRAARLQSYWKKVCEDERKSKARNDQLLQDFNRVEAHIATLSSRTERLRLLKDQYERQVEAMYPYWKEQMEIKQMSYRKQAGNITTSYNAPYHQNLGLSTTQPNVSSVVTLNGTNEDYSSAPLHQPSTSPHNHLHPQVHPSRGQVSHPYAQSHIHGQRGSRPPDDHPRTAPSTLPQAEPAYPTQVVADDNALQLPNQRNTPHRGQQRVALDRILSEPPGQIPPDLNGGSGPTILSPSSMSPHSLMHQVNQGSAASGPLQGTQGAQPGLPRETDQIGGNELQLLGRAKDLEKSRQGDATGARGRAKYQSPHQSFHKETAKQTVFGADKLSSAQTEPFTSDSGDLSDEESNGEHKDKALFSPDLHPELPKYEEGEQLHTQQQKASQQTEEKGKGLKLGESESSGSEDSEIDSDVSLPLSDTSPKSAKPVPAERTTIPPNQPSTTQQNTVALSTTGFWLLLKAVEVEIDDTDSLEGIYASLPCTKTIRDEIVRTANAKTGFDRLDPRAISMVVLEELPLLVGQLQGGCLLSEKLLMASSRMITEVSIRSHMYSSALRFWDDIFHHMVFLVRRGVMEPDAVAKTFAPRLVASNSQAVDKAVSIMSDILLKAEEEEEEITLGDESSLTEASPMSPDNSATSPDVIQRRQPEKPSGYPAVPPLALGGMEGDADDPVDTGRTSRDSFFENSVPLNETSAYQRMMKMTVQQERPREGAARGGDAVIGGGAGSDSEDGDESSEDEIERAARIDVESPAPHQNKKKRNVLSSLGGSLGQSLSSPDDVDEDAGNQTGHPLPSDRTDEVSSPEKSDVQRSPSPGPGGGGGYVPSALEHSLKSTGRTDTMNRSAAFWGNESDLDDESEMSVPMGTEKVDDDKDDFDFYD